MKTTRLQADACPLCGMEVTAATAAPHNARAAPKEDDVTLCLGCGSVLIFGTGLKLRTPTPTELEEIMDSPNAIQMIQAIAEIKGKRGAPQ